MAYFPECEFHTADLEPHASLGLPGPRVSTETRTRKTLNPYITKTYITLKPQTPTPRLAVPLTSVARPAECDLGMLKRLLKEQSGRFSASGESPNA